MAYEVLPGNTSDKTTLEDFLAKIEQQYGQAERIWIMDRGIPTEDSLAAMRGADTPVRYLVGTPRAILNVSQKSGRPGLLAGAGNGMSNGFRLGGLQDDQETADRATRVANTLSGGFALRGAW